jgi:Mor family transcriptional regulator
MNEITKAFEDAIDTDVINNLTPEQLAEVAEILKGIKL